jgi:hypothetical protein
MKNCGATTDDGCFHNIGGEMKYLNGRKHTTNFNNSEYYRFISSDGMMWMFEKEESSDIARIGGLIVDVNGKKEPNVIGRDIFYFNLFANRGFSPFGAYAHYNTNTAITNTQRDAASYESCSTSANGWMCTAKVLSENAMNY